MEPLRNIPHFVERSPVKPDHQLPDAVVACLQRVLVQEWDPAYLITDRSGTLIDQGGNLPVYGLQNLTIGQSLSAQVDFVEGLLPLETDSISLQFLKIGPQTFADIHCFREQERDYIVFVDVTTAEARQGLLQQKANDLHLLRNHHSHLTDLLCEMGLLFVKRLNDTDFYVLGKPPTWIELCGLEPTEQPGVYCAPDITDFLYHFITSEDSRENERVKSGPWVETDNLGREWYFEATKVQKGKDEILMVERLAPYEESRFAIIQKAREQSLAHIGVVKREKLVREKESRNRILLNAVPDWIFKINQTGIILDLKASMGKNPLAFAEFLRKPLNEIFPEQAARSMIECAATAFIAKTLQTCSFTLGPVESGVQFEARVVAISDNEAVLLVREMPQLNATDAKT